MYEGAAPAGRAFVDSPSGGEGGKRGPTKKAPETLMKSHCKGVARGVHGPRWMQTMCEAERPSPPTGKSAGCALDLPTPPQGGEDT